MMKTIVLLAVLGTAFLLPAQINNGGGGASTNPTTNCIPKKTGASTFGDSAWCETGTTVQTAKGETLSIQGATSGSIGFIAPPTGGTGPWTMPVDSAGVFASNGSLGVTLQPLIGGGSIQTVGGVNAITAGSCPYAVLSSDIGRGLSINSATSCAVTIAQSTSSFFAQDSCMDVDNAGTGAVTITPATSTIDGDTKYVLAGHQGVKVCGDSSNYKVFARASDNNPIRNSIFEQSDEFFGHSTANQTIGSLGWRVSGGAAGASFIAGTSGHWGIIRIDSGAAASGTNSLELNTASVEILPRMDTETGWTFGVLLRLNQVTNMRFDFSLTPAGLASLPANAFSIRFDKNAGVADTTFMYTTRNGCVTGTFVCATKTESASATTPGAGTWYYLQLRSLTAGTVLFSINGGAETSIATNLPTAGLMQPRIFCGNDVTASAVNCDIDAFYMKQVGVQRF